MLDRMHSSPHAASPVRMAFATLCFALLTSTAARAQASYQIQPIARILDTVGDAQITLDGWFEVGALNDRGQLLFATLSLNDAGGKNLIRYGDGQFVPIALPGGTMLNSKWPLDLDFLAPVSLNQAGGVAFAATAEIDRKTVFGTFLWDDAQPVTPVALPGRPAVNDLTFETGARFAPMINDGREIVFGAQVRDPAGVVGDALFVRRADGTLVPVALPGEELPGGGAMAGLAGSPAVSDAGAVAFLALSAGNAVPGAYLWEGGAITPVALAGAAAPGGGTIERATGVWVNDQNRAVLVAARVVTNGAAVDALYLFDGEKLSPVVASGQEIPGGGRLQGLQASGISRANDAGQHAFLAYLEGNLTAAYLLDTGGSLSLILKEGDTTPVGRITQIGARPDQFMASFGIALNRGGQVALPVRIDGSADTLVLLTPNMQQ
jgi:hypothetical protein